MNFRSMAISKRHIGTVVAASLVALLTASPVSATSGSGLSAGEWHRRTTMDIPASLKKFPPIAQMMSRPFESDLCIKPERAAQGPIAVLLADDKADCRILSSQVMGASFSAQRECPDKSGHMEFYAIQGTFTPTSLEAMSTGKSKSGEAMTSHTTYTHIGACRPDDIQTTP